MARPRKAAWRRLSSVWEPACVQPISRNERSLRSLLGRFGSYPAVETAVARELHHHVPVTLFEHIGDVYRRLELATDRDFSGIAQLRLAVLLHEESPPTLPRLLAAGGFSDFIPAVHAVGGGFGEVWKARADRELADYVGAHRAHLESLLLFELAHEGRATAAMERASELGALKVTFGRWAGRLADITPPQSRVSVSP